MDMVVRRRARVMINKTSTYSTSVHQTMRKNDLRRGSTNANPRSRPPAHKPYGCPATPPRGARTRHSEALAGRTNATPTFRIPLRPGMKLSVFYRGNLIALTILRAARRSKCPIEPGIPADKPETHAKSEAQFLQSLRFAGQISADFKRRPHEIFRRKAKRRRASPF